ncbi:DUF2306 domain-containing protein [Zhihengliuella salsuginis]|uniref:DUF2306 domain-containing protein n=1 Tax=Zhihengliuella salsuginis TaxID=578222 RepID=A0ABQ3GK01_9MICC|nr:DUF2306 domain-containing protein [Zhihengliuella salsuginis]GHD11442.1 hypothetical protein GCM10008096_26080 [Zhihengliuella salsuginis]
MENVGGTVVMVHAVAALFVLVLGPVQFIRRTKDRVHRYLGRVWLATMVLTCASSFAIMPDGFSWLHGLAIFTLFSVAVGWIHARRHEWRAHAGWMLGAYTGTAIAFVFAAVVPARTIQRTLADDPGFAAVTLAVVLSLSAALFLGLRHGVEDVASQADD